jgi:hypothetical protein
MGQYMVKVNPGTNLPTDYERQETIKKSRALGDLFHKHTNESIVEDLGHDQWSLVFNPDEPDRYFVNIKTERKEECDVICNILKKYFPSYFFEYSYEGPLT